MTATVPGVTPAGNYEIFVRLPGSTPARLSAYPEDGLLLDGQLGGSPIAVTFNTVECALANQVPSVDGDACVCTIGYKSADDQAQAGTVCEPCPEGSYRDDLETDMCQPCEAFKTTFQTASTQKSDCVCERGCVAHHHHASAMNVRQFGRPAMLTRASVASVVLCMLHPPGFP